MKKDNIKFIFTFIGVMLILIGIACGCIFAVRNCILVNQKFGFFKAGLMVFDTLQIWLGIIGIICTILGGVIAYITICE